MCYDELFGFYYVEFLACVDGVVGLCYVEFLDGYVESCFVCVMCVELLADVMWRFVACVMLSFELELR